MYQRPYKAIIKGSQFVDNPWGSEETEPFKSLQEAENAVLLYQKTKDEEKKSKLLDIICKRHWRLVSSYAHEFSSDRFHLQNLIQRGYIGVIKAANEFDPNKNAAWITHFSWRVRGEMHHYIRDNLHLVRQPSKFYDLAPKITSKLKSFRNTDNAEVKKVFSAEEQMTVEEYEIYRNSFGSIMPISHTNNEEEEQDLTETALLENHNICDMNFQAVDDKILFEQLKEQMTEMEFKILYLCCIAEETKVSICEELNITNYKLNKVLEQALRKTKKLLEIDVNTGVG
jgi:RNA polymerase sigma factor (sigma-70 family)